MAAEGRAAAESVDAGSVHQIIDEQLVRAVYQPIVELASGQVVAFEALARGPERSPLESPLALFEAARGCGRLGELDWVCLAAAARGVIEAHLPLDVTLFVNVEPAGLGSPCPPHLVATIGAAAEGRRVVVEMTERALARDPSALFAAVAAVRRSGWRVALDDVGAEPASLALLPFIHPDVIKLDLRLVQDRTDHEVAAIANAVRAHAERTGAAILAEGIETAEHLAVARTLGAAYGQGWLFGRPGPLPVASQEPVPAGGREPVSAGGREPVPQFPTVNTPDPEGAATPFELISRHRQTVLTEKRLLLPMSRYLETQSMATGDAMVVLACFQDDRYFTKRTQARYRDLAACTPFAAVFGAGMPTMPVPGVRGAEIGHDDPLAGEWNVLVVGAHFAGALVARDLGDDGPDPARRFEYVITHDRDLVLAAAHTLLHLVTPVTEV